MFEQSFLPGPARTRRAFTVLASFAGQVLGVGVAVLIPFVLTEHLPAVRMRIPPPAPPARPAGPKTPEHVKIVDVQSQSSGRTVRMFRYMPPQAAPIIDREPLAEAPPDLGAGVAGGVGVPGGDPTGVIGGIARLASENATALPPAPEVRRPEASTQPRPIQRIKRGGVVQEALLIHRVIPEFPHLARVARLSGTVRLQAVIGVDGRVRQLQVVSGHHLFIQAALEAVRQWVYRPTFLNGEPVEVLTQIDVNFIYR